MITNEATPLSAASDAVILEEAEARTWISAYCEEAAAMLRATADRCDADIWHVAQLTAQIVGAGGKVLLCGNGGSAADAQHCAAELVSSLTKSFQRPAIAAIALTTDTSFLTAYSNDYDYGGVFERQVEALGRSGDALILITTSGHSENLCRAAAMARARGITAIGLLGGTGGRLASMVDHTVIVPGSDTQHIQECHTAILHVLCSLIETQLFGRPCPR